jgi:hypothetical protein
MSFLSSITSFVLAIETPPDTVRSISVNMRPMRLTFLES